MWGVAVMERGVKESCDLYRTGVVGQGSLGSVSNGLSLMEWLGSLVVTMSENIV